MLNAGHTVKNEQKQLLHYSTATASVRRNEIGTRAVMPHSQPEARLPADGVKWSVRLPLAPYSTPDMSVCVYAPNHVHAGGELVHMRPLGSDIKDPDLCVRHTTAEPGLGVGLVLDLPVALERPCETQICNEQPSIAAAIPAEHDALQRWPGVHCVLLLLYSCNACHCSYRTCSFARKAGW